MIVQTNKTVHLQGKNFSYVLVENEEGDLLNFHYGQKIAVEDYAADPELWEEGAKAYSNTANLSSFPQEYPAYGHGDFRSPAYQLINGFGNPISCLRVKERKIHSGCAVQIPELPSLFGSGQGVDTLEMVLEDAQIGLEVHLFYAVFEEFDAVARHAVLHNQSDKPMTLRKALSANLDLPEDQYHLIHFPGGWANERQLQRTVLGKGVNVEVTDTTGRGSRETNPFVMLVSANADEDHGNVYGMNLVYSSNHTTVAQTDNKGKLRIQQGISPLNFSWNLQPGECFYTPQCVMCFSSQGMGHMSRQYHRLYRKHLIRSEFADQPRPVLINNWEATYFEFNEDKLLKMAKIAKQTGIELFVLDDGWFGKRNSTRSSLGDWYANEEKLPSGIAGLAQKINALGLRFGLWFEPEMVSPDSELYRAHPDWAIAVPNMEPVQQRWQYVLDLSRPEICDYVVDAVGKILNCGHISYVKWDMNRNITDIPSEGYFHRYVLGYYRIVKQLTERFPDILFEGCCSGGGRFDPGVLAYMPQIWTSDNSDAICRLKIQYSTSMCYPLSTMGAHVSAVPNHQVGRVTSLKTRADVACSGVFGYELDITSMTDEELEQMAQQIRYAKHIQPLILSGDLYRLRSPYETNECIWQVLSEKKEQVFVMACRVLAGVGRNSYFEPKVKLKGLDPEAIYEDIATGKRYSGSLLMHRGLPIRYAVEDFASVTVELEKV